MTSEKQIQANRENAQWATGPGNTEQTRFNAIKIGLTGAHFVLLPGEDADLYREHLESYLASYRPVDSVEEKLVVTIAQETSRPKTSEPALETISVGWHTPAVQMPPPQATLQPPQLAASFPPVRVSQPLVKTPSQLA